MAGLQEDIDIIKSLIAITRGGLLVEKLDKEYQDMTESRLNFRKYGFNSLLKMLESSRDIVLSNTPEGIVCKVHDEKMSHVTSLVNRTQPAKKRTNKKHGYHVKSRPSYHTTSRRFSSPHTQQRTGYQNRGSSYSRYEPCHRQSFQPSNKPQYQQRYSSMVRTQVLASCSGRMSSRSPTPKIQSVVVKPVEEKHQYHHKDKDNYLMRTAGASGKESASVKQSFRDQVSNPRTHDSKSVQRRLSPPNSTCSKDTISHNFSSGLSVNKARLKEVCARSGSGSDWSSDSVEQGKLPEKFTKPNSSSGWSSSTSDKSLCGKKFTDLREVQVKEREAVTSKKPFKVASRFMKVSNLCITVPNKNGGGQNCEIDSDSDWSSDLESPPSHKELQRNAPPAQNDTVSSSTFTSPPLMVGGLGRGRARLRDHQIMMAPGPKDIGVPSGDASRSQQGVTVVSGTPNKREALASSSNGHSTIVVKVLNGRSVQNVRKSSVCAEPCYGDHQFVGDYFLLQVAEMSLRSKIVKDGPVSICGLCRSNLTIIDCENAMMKYGVSEKIVMMIGMTDILQGATILEMRSRMTSLLQRLGHMQLVLLSLPVPPSFIKAENERKLSVLEAFNKWLLQLPWQVIDIDRHLYSDAPFYMRAKGNEFETFSDGGCWVVMDEIISAITTGSRR